MKIINPQKEETTLSIIFSVISIIIGLISLASYLFSGYNWLLENNLTHILIPLGIGIFTTILFVLFFKNKDYLYIWFLSCFMKMSAVESSYKLVKSVGTYEYISRTSMKFTYIASIKVLKGYFEGLPLFYKWTGDDKVNAKCISAGQKLEIRDDDFQDGMQHYFLKASNNACSFSKKDTVPELGYITEVMNDTKNKSLPYLSKGVANITDTLILKVIFSHDVNPKNIRLITYIHYCDVKHFVSEDATLRLMDDGRKYVEWTVKKPIYGGKYMISWIIGT